MVGADSINLHLENIRAYEQAAKNRGGVTKDIQRIHKELRKLIDKNFPEEMKEWLKLKARHQNGQLPLIEYLERIYSLRRTLQTAGGIEALLSGDEKKIRKVDLMQLLQEIKQLEEEIVQASLPLVRDQQTYGYYQSVLLLEKLNAIELSHEEFTALKASLEGLKTEDVAKFIARETGHSIVLFRSWESLIADATGFYELAKKRDEAIEKILSQTNDQRLTTNEKESRRSMVDGHQSPNTKTDVSVLVFGGFHKEAIKRILKEKGISYAILSPSIGVSSKRHENYYRMLMSGGKHSFEKLESVSKGLTTSDQRLVTNTLKLSGSTGLTGEVLSPRERKGEGKSRQSSVDSLQFGDSIAPQSNRVQNVFTMNYGPVIDLLEETAAPFRSELRKEFVLNVDRALARAEIRGKQIGTRPLGIVPRDVQRQSESLVPSPGSIRFDPPLRSEGRIRPDSSNLAEVRKGGTKNSKGEAFDDVWKRWKEVEKTGVPKSLWLQDPRGWKDNRERKYIKDLSRMDLARLGQELVAKFGAKDELGEAVIEPGLYLRAKDPVKGFLDFLSIGSTGYGPANLQHHVSLPQLGILRDFAKANPSYGRKLDQYEMFLRELCIRWSAAPAKKPALTEKGPASRSKVRGNEKVHDGVPAHDRLLHVKRLGYMLVRIDQKNLIEDIPAPGAQDRLTRYFLGKRVVNIGPETYEDAEHFFSGRSGYKNYNIAYALQERGIDVKAVTPRTGASADRIFKEKPELFVEGLDSWMPFSDSSKDAVISINLYERSYYELDGEVSQEQYDAVAVEIRRVLVNGGLFLVDTGGNPKILTALKNSDFTMTPLDKYEEVWLCINQKIIPIPSGDAGHRSEMRNIKSDHRLETIDHSKNRAEMREKRIPESHDIERLATQGLSQYFGDGIDHFIMSVWEEYGISNMSFPASFAGKLARYYGSFSRKKQLVPENVSWMIAWLACGVFNEFVIKTIREHGIFLLPDEEKFLWQIFYSRKFKERSLEDVDPYGELFRRVKEIAAQAESSARAVVLDLGSGPQAVALRDLHRELIASGIDAEKLDFHGVDLVASEQTLEGVQIHAQDVRRLEWPDNSVDLAFDSKVLLYYDSDPIVFQSIISEILRVLKPGGELIIFSPDTFLVEHGQLMAAHLNRLGTMYEMEPGLLVIKKESSADSRVRSEIRSAPPSQRSEGRQPIGQAGIRSDRSDDQAEMRQIEIFDSVKHDAVYGWVKAKVASGEWVNDLMLINFDYHPDDYTQNPEMGVGDWAGYLKRDKLIGKYVWVYANEVFSGSHDVDFKTGDPAALPDLPGRSVIVTIDMDYFIPIRRPEPTKEALKQKVSAMVDGLLRKNYDIKGINITHSSDMYIHVRWENYLQELLISELKRLNESVRSEIRDNAMKIFKPSISSRIISSAKFGAFLALGGVIFLSFKTALPYTSWIGATMITPIVALGAYRLFKLRHETAKKALFHNIEDLFAILFIATLFYQYRPLTPAGRLLFAHDIKRVASQIGCRIFFEKEKLIHKAGVKEIVGDNTEVWTIKNERDCKYHIAKIKLSEAVEIKVAAGSVTDAKEAGAIAAVNGGYAPSLVSFDALNNRGQPQEVTEGPHVGLVKSDGKIISEFWDALAVTDQPIGNAIFGVKPDGTVVIRKVPLKRRKEPESGWSRGRGSYTALHAVDEEKMGEVTGDLKDALQLGPILIWNGKVVAGIPDDEPSSWSFVGLTEDGSLLIGSEVSGFAGAQDGRTHQDVAFQLKDWAERNHVKLKSVIACDGGGFASLWAGGAMRVLGHNPSANSILIMPSGNHVPAAKAQPSRSEAREDATSEEARAMYKDEGGMDHTGQPEDEADKIKILVEWAGNTRDEIIKLRERLRELADLSMGQRDDAYKMLMVQYKAVVGLIVEVYSIGLEEKECGAIMHTLTHNLDMYGLQLIDNEVIFPEIVASSSNIRNNENFNTIDSALANLERRLEEITKFQTIVRARSDSPGEYLLDFEASKEPNPKKDSAAGAAEETKDPAPRDKASRAFPTKNSNDSKARSEMRGRERDSYIGTRASQNQNQSREPRPESLELIRSETRSLQGVPEGLFPVRPLDHLAVRTEDDSVKSDRNSFYEAARRIVRSEIREAKVRILDAKDLARQMNGRTLLSNDGRTFKLEVTATGSYVEARAFDLVTGQLPENSGIRMAFQAEDGMIKDFGIFIDDKELKDKRIGSQMIRALGDAVPAGIPLLVHIENMETRKQLFADYFLDPAGDLRHVESGRTVVDKQPGETAEDESSLYEVLSDTKMGRLFGRGGFTIAIPDDHYLRLIAAGSESLYLRELKAGFRMAITHSVKWLPAFKIMFVRSSAVEKLEPRPKSATDPSGSVADVPHKVRAEMREGEALSLDQLPESIPVFTLHQGDYHSEAMGYKKSHVHNMAWKGNYYVLKTAHNDRRRALVREAVLSHFVNPGKISKLPKIVAFVELPDIDSCGIVLERFPEGLGLREHVKDSGAKSERKAVGIAIQVAELVQEHIHGAGIVHRDLTPRNIRLTLENDVVVFDLELSRPRQYDLLKERRQEGNLRWPTQYTPREIVFFEKKPDFVDDTFALGASLYFMVMGFDLPDEYVMKEERAPVKDLLKSEGVSQKVIDIIMRATHSDRSQRYEDMAAMLSDLRAWEGAERAEIREMPLKVVFENAKQAAREFSDRNSRSEARSENRSTRAPLNLTIRYTEAFYNAISSKDMHPQRRESLGERFYEWANRALHTSDVSSFGEGYTGKDLNDYRKEKWEKKKWRMIFQLVDDSRLNVSDPRRRQVTLVHYLPKEKIEANSVVQAAVKRADAQHVLDPNVPEDQEKIAWLDSWIYAGTREGLIDPSDFDLVRGHIGAFCFGPAQYAANLPQFFEIHKREMKLLSQSEKHILHSAIHQMQEVLEEAEGNLDRAATRWLGNGGRFSLEMIQAARALLEKWIGMKVRLLFLMGQGDPGIKSIARIYFLVAGPSFQKEIQEWVEAWARKQPTTYEGLQKIRSGYLELRKEGNLFNSPVIEGIIEEREERLRTMPVTSKPVVEVEDKKDAEGASVYVTMAPPPVTKEAAPAPQQVEPEHFKLPETPQLEEAIKKVKSLFREQGIPEGQISEAQARTALTHELDPKISSSDKAKKLTEIFQIKKEKITGVRQRLVEIGFPLVAANIAPEEAAKYLKRFLQSARQAFNNGDLGRVEQLFQLVELYSVDTQLEHFKAETAVLADEVKAVKKWLSVFFMDSGELIPLKEAALADLVTIWDGLSPKNQGIVRNILSSVENKEKLKKFGDHDVFVAGYLLPFAQEEHPGNGSVRLSVHYPSIFEVLSDHQFNEGIQKLGKAKYPSFVLVNRNSINLDRIIDQIAAENRSEMRGINTVDSGKRVVDGEKNKSPITNPPSLVSERSEMHQDPVDLGTSSALSGSARSEMRENAPALVLGKGSNEFLDKVFVSEKTPRNETFALIQKFLASDYAPAVAVRKEVDLLSDQAKIELARRLIKDENATGGALCQEMTLEQVLLRNSSEEAFVARHMFGRWLGAFDPEQTSQYWELYAEDPESLSQDQMHWKAIHSILWAAELMSVRSEVRGGDIDSDFRKRWVIKIADSFSTEGLKTLVRLYEMHTSHRGVDRFLIEDTQVEVRANAPTLGLLEHLLSAHGFPTARFGADGLLDITPIGGIQTLIAALGKAVPEDKKTISSANRSGAQNEKPDESQEVTNVPNLAGTVYRSRGEEIVVQMEQESKGASKDLQKAFRWFEAHLNADSVLSDLRAYLLSSLTIDKRFVDQADSVEEALRSGKGVCWEFVSLAHYILYMGHVRGRYGIDEIRMVGFKGMFSDNHVTLLVKQSGVWWMLDNLRLTRLEGTSYEEAKMNALDVFREGDLYVAVDIHPEINLDREKYEISIKYAPRTGKEILGEPSHASLIKGSTRMSEEKPAEGEFRSEKRSEPVVKTGEVFASYKDTGDFIARHVVTENGVSYTVQDVFARELPSALYALEKIIELRRVMDESGSRDTPLIIWQNMRLGEFFPYFSEIVKRRLGILELSEDVLKWSDQVADLQSGKTRFLLIKQKIASSFPGENKDYANYPEEEWDPSVEMWSAKEVQKIAKALRSPVVMVDHTGKDFSNGQKLLADHARRTGMKTHWIPSGLSDDLGSDKDLLTSGSPLLLLNANAHPERRKSLFDDSESFSKSGQNPPIVIRGQKLSFYDVFMEAFAAATSEGIQTKRTIPSIPRGSVSAHHSDPLQKVRRSEKRFDVEKSGQTVRAAIENLKGKFTIVSDMADVAAFTDKQLEEFEVMAHLSPNVKFVFNGKRPEVLSMGAGQRLRQLQADLGANRIVITENGSEDMVLNKGEKVIAISKGTRALGLGTRKGVYQFRYVAEETGLVPMALLYADQHEKPSPKGMMDLSMVSALLRAELREFQNSIVFARAA